MNTTIPCVTTEQVAPLLIFTAAEIALRIGCSKVSVLTHVSGVVATGTKRVRGQDTRAWSFDALPELLREKIRVAAMTVNPAGPIAFLARGAVVNLDIAPPAPPPLTITARLNELHPQLAEWLEAFQFARRTNYTADERAQVWTKILSYYGRENRFTKPDDRAAFKTGLLAFLLCWTPGLVSQRSTNRPHALRCAFDRKLDAFEQEGGLGLRDGRAALSGNAGEQFCDPCWLKLLQLLGDYDGIVSRTFREAKIGKRLCEKCDALHRFDIRKDKSRVPHSVRIALAGAYNRGEAMLKGRAAVLAAEPYIDVEHNEKPGDIFVSDDVTFNHWVWRRLRDGSVKLFVPECLVMVDKKTSYPIAWLLIEDHYNGLDPRRLKRIGNDNVGLPRRGYEDENGIWRAILANVAFPHHGRKHSDFETGLLSMPAGYPRIGHFKPQNPKAKVAEGVFRILQDMMRPEPGFRGFNAREEETDEMKRMKRLVLSGKEPPEKFFYSFDQWHERLDFYFDKFANEPQNGTRNPGISPAEHWREYLIQGHPLKQLTGPIRTAVFSDCGPYLVKVRGNVVAVRPAPSQKPWRYSGADVARFEGRDVFAYWNMDEPELLSFTNTEGTEHFTGKLMSGRAVGMTKDDHRELNRAKQEALEPGRRLAGVMKKRYALTVTHADEGTPQERERGQFVIEQTARHVAERRAETAASNRRERRSEALLFGTDANRQPEGAEP